MFGAKRTELLTFNWVFAEFPVHVLMGGDGIRVALSHQSLLWVIDQSNPQLVGSLSFPWTVHTS